MKRYRRAAFLLLIMAAVALASPAQAVEFMYRGNKGYQHYSCGAERRGGFVKVKQIGPTRYRIYSKRMTGDFEISPATVEKSWCLGPVGAVRIVCGFCEVPIESIHVSTDE